MSPHETPTHRMGSKEVRIAWDHCYPWSPWNLPRGSRTSIKSMNPVYPNWISKQGSQVGPETFPERVQGLKKATTKFFLKRPKAGSNRAQKYGKQIKRVLDVRGVLKVCFVFYGFKLLQNG